MRPAQKAPENGRGGGRRRPDGRCFNEAGAKSAGKREDDRHGIDLPCSFNEAGAKSAGKQWMQRGMQASARASMRPAQKAPENTGIAGRRRLTVSGFNEAGAKSAGKLAQAN